MRGLIIATTAALFGGHPPLAEVKGSCGYERCFGAIAIGESNAMSRATGYQTVPDAVKSAKALCGDGCTTVEVFWNACGAVALSSSGDWSFGWHEELETAQSKAIAACVADHGTGCYVREWACSK